MSGRVYRKCPTVHSSRDFSIAVWFAKTNGNSHFYHSHLSLWSNEFYAVSKKLQTLASKNLKSKNESSRTVTLCVHFPNVFLLLLLSVSVWIRRCFVEKRWIRAIRIRWHNKSLKGFECRWVCAEFVRELSIQANAVILRSSELWLCMCVCV